MDDQDLILDQMEDTRSALTEKLELLEDKVATTVKDATQEVAETVETVTGGVQETVETVKETVEGTLNAFQEGVDAIKSIFDIPQHFEHYPWLALGGSIACGYLLGDYLTRNHRVRPRSPQSYQGSRSSAAETFSANGQANGRKKDFEPEPDNANPLLEEIRPELSRLKGLAIGTLMGTVREMITKAAGDNLKEPLAEIIDSVTEKIGGTPIPTGPQSREMDELREKAQWQSDRQGYHPAMPAAGSPLS